MDPATLAVGALALVLVLLALRTPIAFALGFPAALGTLLFFAWPHGGEFALGRAWRPALSILANVPYEFVHSFELSMVPLFIALGHIAFHARITTDIYEALRVWLARTPGGLAIASVVGCGGFSAITGSSVACAAAMGRIAVPEMLRFGYAAPLATGAVAAGGTLGSLIPPSLLFVIYAIFTEQSVKALFLAGILPGLASLAGYVITIAVWARRRAGDAPLPALKFARAEKWRELRKIWPAVLLLAVVIGGLYFGLFETTEAAAISACLAAAIGFATGRLSWRGFWDALKDTVFQTAMIFAIAISAKIFVSFLSLTRLATSALDTLQAAGIPAWAVVLLVILLYLVLGMFLDSIGILVLTLPLVVPLMEGQGFNLVWFGVVVVKLLEIGLITPPIGLNVFVIAGIMRDEVRTEQVFLGALRFLYLDAAVLALIVLVPWLSLALPAAAL
jgi:tripartite ATP-independent transporter DctM subunit